MSYLTTNQPITSAVSFPDRLPLRFLDYLRDFESCMRAITQSGRWPGNEAIGTHVIYSESEEAAASSASVVGTPMIRTLIVKLSSYHFS